MAIATSAYQYLEKLERMTDALPHLESVAVGSGPFKEYPCHNGFAVAVNLYWSAEVGICQCWISSGAVFPAHVHKEFENIVVLKGTGKVVYNGKEEVYSECSVFSFEPYTNHEWSVERDTILICTTIPASLGFPHGQST